MLENISFVGGIHGVGKSTICKSICEKLNINYLSASEVLKWSKLNTDIKNKKVDNISFTQDLLINGLNEQVNKSEHYILDGHYCLFNKERNVERIPFETFQKINPASLHVITGNIVEIKKHLEERDQRPYNYKLLEEMQDAELEYANEISQRMLKPLVISTSDNFTKLSATIFNLIK